MFFILLVTLIILSISSIIVHSTGIYLLLYSFQHGRLAVQKKYLLNLSICEIIFNIFELVKCVSSIISMYDSTNSVALYANGYIIQMSSGDTLVLYLIMIYITIDRFMVGILSEIYPLYWRGSRARILLIMTWITCIIISFSLTLVQEYVGFNSTYAISFCYEVLDFCFIMLAVISCSYSCMTKKVKRKIQTRKTKRVIAVYLKSKVDASILLICTFMSFMTIPNIIHNILPVDEPSNKLSASFSISYQLMTLFHGFICIFMHRPVIEWLHIKEDSYLVTNPIIIASTTMRNTEESFTLCPADAV